MEINNRFQHTLEELRIAGNYRTLPEQKDYVVDLSSNDYLGLNNNKQLYTGFLNALNNKAYKFSSASSRLLSGNSIEYAKLEQLIADKYNTEACIIYNSGYHANLGILPAITGKKDLIIADKLVHASIIDAVTLSKAEVVRFKHLDYNHLEKILERNKSNYEHIFIVTESIFSMDGDIADLVKLVELKQKYNCLLYIDEAHALGVRGKNGLGCVEENDVIEHADFIVGTFGKALASIGAFVVCNNLFKHYLVNHSRTLIYTTALPPINLAWTKYVFEKLPELNHLRKTLNDLTSQFSAILNLKTESHIVPFIIGSNKDAIAASAELKQLGFNVLPIRYPTVPKGTARLRFSLNAGMDINQLTPIKNIISKHEHNLVK